MAPGALARPYITRHEWLWATAWSLSVLALTAVPYLWCVLHQTAQWRFTGQVYDVRDINTYLAEMQHGARGEWLLHLPFTSEDHPRALVHPLYLLLGKIAAVTRWSVLTVYHGARLAFGLGALLVIYRFIAQFSPYLAVRRTAFLLTGFGGGLGWLVLILAGPDWLGDMPIDFWVPEAFTFPILYGFPHIALSLALLLGALLFYLQAAERISGRSHPEPECEQDLAWRTRELWQPALTAGVLTLFLGFIVPFDILVVYAAVGAYIAGRLIQTRHWPSREVIAALGLASVSAPSLLYNAYIFTFNPAFKEWSRQNLGLSPHPLHFVVSYAFLLLLALPGVFYLWRRKRGLFLITWVLADVALIYSPFNLQRRLIIGLHPVLCLLVAVSLSHFLLPWWSRTQAPILVRWSQGRYTRRGLRRLALTTVLLSTLPSTLLLLAGPMLQAPTHIPPLYQPQSIVAASDWLRAHTALNDVVLSAYETGNYLPARAGNWVYLGHGAITAHYAEKQQEVARFFGTQMSDEERRQFLLEKNIAYVIHGPYERALGDYPAEAAFLQPVYRDDVVIYKVSLK